MARCEPRVSCINIKKYLKSRKISQFGLAPNVRERERERERREKKTNFSGDFIGFCQSELGKPRVKAALRDESYAWVPKSQDFVKVQGSDFHENREKVVSQEITQIEVGFLYYSV